MKAIAVTTPGGPEVLVPADVPIPAIGSDEVLVEVVAAGVNRADLLLRQGFYPPPPGASKLLGLECSGRVAAVGQNVQGWSVTCSSKTLGAEEGGWMGGGWLGGGVPSRLLLKGTALVLWPVPPPPDGTSRMLARRTSPMSRLRLPREMARMTKKEIIGAIQMNYEDIGEFLMDFQLMEENFEMSELMEILEPYKNKIKDGILEDAPKEAIEAINKCKKLSWEQGQ